ncbi:phosphonate ABC transporter ATP-binding protein [candidate division GN15 bacterium]|uniref:Phosphonate ABC transporter ATP-binding protein n=1 Tax=candidate division GN15 bacterium TaxID=2072418 RepID=A0A855XCF0_9BACT|nr:MAG: phosphonate ABC transporter ATP-binding protein [candidate division GN15 bacterium]
MIQLNGISKIYPGKVFDTYVLRDVDFKVNEGEFVTIMGPSGAGKSTLLNIIGMLDDFSEGEYHFLDQPVHKLNDKKRAELCKAYIGFIFQSYHLIEELTVYENIETPLLYRKVKSGDRKSLVCDMLDRFGIVGKKDLFPSQLSGGQQQLVGIARAIVGGPRLLLADEPTGNLHSKQGEETMAIFRQLNRDGTTILQVTHSDKNAAYGNRILHLHDGLMTDQPTER